MRNRQLDMSSFCVLLVLMMLSNLLKHTTSFSTHILSTFEHGCTEQNLLDQVRRPQEQDRESTLLHHHHHHVRISD